MRFITFVKRCDTPTMIRCMMGALEYFEGLPQAALTDRMKSVFLQMDGTTPIWNPVFADFAACLGMAARVCKPRKPQTKGKIERSVGIIKDGFWPGVRFTDSDDLNEQARAWCDRLNQKVHRTTQCVPMDRWIEEQLRPLPTDYAWERFGAEDGIRQLGWLPVLRWGALWITGRATGGRIGRPGARTPAAVARLFARQADCHPAETASFSADGATP